MKMNIFYRLKTLSLLFILPLIVGGAAVYLGSAAHQPLSEKMLIQADSSQTNRQSMQALAKKEDDQRDSDNIEQVDEGESRLNYNFIVFLLYKFVKSNAMGGSH
jgi:hypothetical protein